MIDFARDSRRLLALACILLLVGACSVRSISNSGYGAGHGTDNAFYHGELTELDVLGIDPQRPVADAEIARALDSHRRIEVRKGSSLLVLQSGAVMPDDAMVKALSPSFSVTPFSGVPVSIADRAPIHVASAGASTGDTIKSASYAEMLRLAAARSGAEIIVCYWGLLESGVENHVTKVISWVPIVGAAIPDQSQRMRIRLKVAVIDVRTGDWSMFSPESYSDISLSAQINRGSSDQMQVELLKEEAYKAAADQLVARYAP